MISRNLNLIYGMTALVMMAGCASRSQNIGPFRAQYVSGLTQPEVLLQNNSDKTIQVDLYRETNSNELQDVYKTLIVRPSQTINTPIDPGEYRYHATCPGVIPASGTTDFQKNYRYSWVFYIETGRY